MGYFYSLGFSLQPTKDVLPIFLFSFVLAINAASVFIVSP